VLRSSSDERAAFYAVIDGLAKGKASEVFRNDRCSRSANRPLTAFSG
jgi:hypothetical protein